MRTGLHFAIDYAESLQGLVKAMGDRLLCHPNIDRSASSWDAVWEFWAGRIWLAEAAFKELKEFESFMPELPEEIRLRIFNRVGNWIMEGYSIWETTDINQPFALGTDGIKQIDKLLSSVVSEAKHLRNIATDLKKEAEKKASVARKRLQELRDAQKNRLSNKEGSNDSMDEFNREHQLLIAQVATVGPSFDLAMAETVLWELRVLKDTRIEDLEKKYRWYKAFSTASTQSAAEIARQQLGIGELGHVLKAAGAFGDKVFIEPFLDNKKAEEKRAIEYSISTSIPLYLIPHASCQVGRVSAMIEKTKQRLAS